MNIPDEVFAGRPHRATMGLRPLDLTTWLDPDPSHPQKVQRAFLLRERRAEVSDVLPGREPAARSVAQEVAIWCGTILPGKDEPLVEAAALVRDDLCVLERVAGQWRLVAAVVCFPSRWRLAEKMGQDVVSIHGPVPGYRSRLGPPTERVLGALSPRWRINWTLVDDPALFQPAPPAHSAGPPDPSWFLRVERQCLLPVGQVAAFTIQTDVVALRDLDEQRREAVLSSAAGAPEDLASYRGWRSR